MKAGDVVYVEGASAMLGDVLAVDDDGVRVQWRLKITTEQPDDLVRVSEPLAQNGHWQGLEPKQEEQAAPVSSRSVSDAEYVEAAKAWEKGNDELIVQKSPLEDVNQAFVDRVDGGAWVMAWLFVPDGDV